MFLYLTPTNPYYSYLLSFYLTHNDICYSYLISCIWKSSLFPYDILNHHYYQIDLICLYNNLYYFHLCFLYLTQNEYHYSQLIFLSKIIIANYLLVLSYLTHLKKLPNIDSLLLRREEWKILLAQLKQTVNIILLSCHCLVQTLYLICQTAIFIMEKLAGIILKKF